MLNIFYSVNIGNPLLDRNKMYSGEISYCVTADGKMLLTRKWEGKKNAPVVFVGHSQPTHSGHFLDICNSFHLLGWGVFSGDLRSHGGSLTSGQKSMHLSSDESWEALIDDFDLLIEKAFDGVSFERRVLAVQNITALLTLEILKRKPNIAKHIVMTLPSNNKVTAALARTFVKARMAFKPHDVPDPQTLHHLYSFLSARVKDKKHIADVMSADREVVDNILADPLGFPTPTLSYWNAIFKGYDVAWQWPKDHKINPHTRVMLLNGAEDPLVANGSLSQTIITWLQTAGANHLTAHQVEGGRTAILLDERSLNISSIIHDWIYDGQTHTQPSEGCDLSFTDISKDVISGYCMKGNAEKVDLEVLISLCYDAVDDEERWNEVLYHLAWVMSENEDSEALEKQFQILMPHLDRSFKINQKMSHSAALGVVLESVINRLDIGTALLTKDLNITYHNQAFVKALEMATGEADPSHLKNIMDKEFREQLAKGNDTAVLSYSGHPIGFYFKPEALRLIGNHENAPAGLLIMRVKSSNEKDAEDVASSSRISMLELAYGFTTQEAVISLEIAGGLSPIAIADKLDVSINTIRTHLKRAYDKMGVDGQTEMVARLMSGPIGWLA